MPRQPTTVVRVADDQLAEAMAATGLPAAPAVRQVLARGLASRRNRRKPPPDMPPAQNGATVAVETRERTVFMRRCALSDYIDRLRAEAAAEVENG